MLISRNIKLNRHFNVQLKCIFGATKVHSTDATTTASSLHDNELLLKSAKPYREIPSPLLWPIIGSAWVFLPLIGRYNILKQHLANRHKRQRYGDIWREKLGPLNITISCKAEDMETLCRNEGPYPNRGEFTCIKHYRQSRKQWYKSTGLLMLEGKEWQDLRRKTQKHLMKPKAIEAYVGPMQEVAKDFVQRIGQIKDSKDEVDDFLQELYKWSLESVAYVGLDARLGTLQSEDSEGMKIITAVQTQFELMSKLEGFLGNIQIWKLFPTPKWRKFEKAADEFSEIAFKYVSQACDKLKKLEKSSEQELTLLQAMLAEKGLELGGAMVTVVDMMFGGIDTTSHTAGFFLYEMAKHPKEQEILHKEITELLSSTGGKLTPKLVLEMKYLKACLKETLRLHPVIPVGARILDHDVVLSGYRIPKNTFTVILLQEICLDERYFNDPAKFIPERWLSREYRRHRFAYLPFGFGPRSCIGKRLAELEITCLITEVIKRFKVEYKYEDIDVITKFVNAPDKPLKFNFVERN